MSKNNERACFAGGCFWGVQHLFTKIRGVLRVEAGYAGGHLESPTYQDICRGDTGHAEVVRIHYDSTQISYEALLNYFFRMHDPTQLNRQGADVGSQYRSAIFYYTDEQRSQALSFIERFNKRKVFPNPAVTELVPMGKFYLAE